MATYRISFFAIGCTVTRNDGVTVVLHGSDASAFRALLYADTASQYSDDVLCDELFTGL